MAKQDYSALIIIGILVVLAIGAWIQLQEIYFAQFMFWATLVLIPIGFIVAIIFFVRGIQGWGEEENYIPWIIFAICIVVVLFSIAHISNFYNNGYSNKAIQKEIELKGEINQY